MDDFSTYYHIINKNLNEKTLADSLNSIIPRNIFCKIKHFRTQPQHIIKMLSHFLLLVICVFLEIITIIFCFMPYIS